MGATTDDSDGKVQPHAAAYAAALRQIVDSYQEAGGTQKRLAEHAHVATATVSRYLSGTRLAPPDFLDVLTAYGTTLGVKLENPTRQDLEGLCSRAHQASRSPAVQLRATRKELGATRRELEATRAELDAAQTDLAQTRDRVHRADLTNTDVTSRLQAIRTRLDTIEQRNHHLEKNLQHAQAEALAAQQRTAHAEQERDALAAQAETQMHQLTAATAYIVPLEVELAQLKELVPQLRQQVSVLQHQNNELLTPIVDIPDEVPPQQHVLQTTVPGVSTQVSDASPTDHSPDTPARPPADLAHPTSSPVGKSTTDASSNTPPSAAPQTDITQPPAWKPNDEILTRHAHEFLDARTHGEFIAALHSLYWARKRSKLPHGLERRFVHALRGDPLAPGTRIARDSLIEQVRCMKDEEDAMTTAFDRLSGFHPRGAQEQISYRYSGGLTPTRSLILYAAAWIYLWLFLQPPTSSPLLLAMSAINLPVAILCIYAGLNRWAGPPRILWYLHHIAITTALLLPWLPPSTHWPIWLPNLL